MSKWEGFGCCIFMSCYRRLDELLGRDSWNSWDVEFLAAAGIMWTLQQCAQQGCSHQHQEKLFSQFRAGAQSLPSVTLLGTSMPGDNCNLWVMKGWRSLVWKMWSGSEVQSSEDFHMALFALEGQAQLRDPVIPLWAPPWIEVSGCSTKTSFFSFKFWFYFPRFIMRWSPGDFLCIIQLQKYPPFLL